MNKTTAPCHTIPELENLLKTDRKQIMDLIYSGELTAFRLGKRWRIPHQALTDYISKNTYKPGA